MHLEDSAKKIKIKATNRISHNLKVVHSIMSNVLFSNRKQSYKNEN